MFRELGTCSSCALLCHPPPDCLDGFLESCSLTPAPHCLAFTSPHSTTGSSTQGSHEVLLAERGLSSALALHTSVCLRARGKLESGTCPAAPLGKAGSGCPGHGLEAPHMPGRCLSGDLLLIPIQVPRMSLHRGCSLLESDAIEGGDGPPHLEPHFTFQAPCPFFGLCQLCSRSCLESRPE